MSLGTALAIALVSFLLYDMVAGGYFPDYKRCRQPIVRGKYEPGKCDNHYKKWAYNSSCSDCVQFEYTGCGGDDNNFEDKDECLKCCKNTPACPKYKLAPPPPGCKYKWFTGHDGCHHYKLECECEKQYCKPDSCKTGFKCVTKVRTCDAKECPCKQYECVRNPCEPWYRKHQHSKCEICIPVRKPQCPTNTYCPLVAHYKNKCKHSHSHSHHHSSESSSEEITTKTTTRAPTTPHSSESSESHEHHKCGHHSYHSCKPNWNPCKYRKCRKHPYAQCQVDKCDCRKCYWKDHGREYHDNDCD